MNATVAQLTARSLLGRRRALLLLALPAVLLLLCGAVRLLAGPDTDVSVGLLGGFALGTIVPLLGLIAGAGAIGPEIDDGSIVYLLSKPVSRHSIVRSKLAVAVAVVIVVAAVPTLLAGLVLSGTAEGIAVGYAIGAGVAGLAYCALFVLLAILTRNAVVVGLIYVLLWESLVGSFVPGAQVLSIQQWALAVTQQVLGASAAPLGVSSAVSFGAGVALIAVVVAGCTWFAGSRLRTLRLTASE
jgi:ABC-2 type transport system permease protein